MLVMMNATVTRSVNFTLYRMLTLGMKVHRGNWHSAGSWLAIFNAKILIYLSNKIYGREFYQTALGNCYGLKLPKC